MVYENTRLGRYTMTGSRWKNVSEDAKNFIRRLLLTNPKERMSVTDALQHSWIVNRTLNNLADNKAHKSDSKRLSRQNV
jgi:serine/threonine protein kinase